VRRWLTTSLSYRWPWYAASCDFSATVRGVNSHVAPCLITAREQLGKVKTVVTILCYMNIDYL
jgi:hypothetical protein